MPEIPQAEIDQAVTELTTWVMFLGGFDADTHRLDIGDQARLIVAPLVRRYDSGVSAGDIWYPGGFFTEDSVELAMLNGFDDKVIKSAGALINLARAKLASTV